MRQDTRVYTTGRPSRLTRFRAAADAHACEIISGKYNHHTWGRQQSRRQHSGVRGVPWVSCRLGRMSYFKRLAELAPQDIWDGVVARTVEGARMSFAVVELAPGGVVAAHQHDNEQIGVVLSGSLSFTIGGETRALRAGDTYN